MGFSVTHQTVVNPCAPLHRLAAKTQIKILESEEAEILSNGKLNIFTLRAKAEAVLRSSHNPCFLIRNKKSNA